MSGDLFQRSSAIISPCGLFRYRLERGVQPTGIVIAYFGVNGSTATADEDDHTVRKLIGFSLRFDCQPLILGNAFGFRATDVRALARAEDPVGPANPSHLVQIIADADILVPCWGAREKLPPRLRPQLDRLAALLVASGKPVKVFGVTTGGDPMHPQMLGYNRTLQDWAGYSVAHPRDRAMLGTRQ